MAAARIGIIDYQAGNLRSICNAFDREGALVRLVREGTDLAECSHLVLPGVGAFPHCMRSLHASGMVPYLREWAVECHRPVLGICVGMQMFAERGEEIEASDGLGWMRGRVERLPASSGVRVPHVGWNDVCFHESERALDGCYYFDHSFAFMPTGGGPCFGTSDHGKAFCAAVRNGPMIGVQFHPEKSQAAGLRLVRWFTDLEAGAGC